MIFSSPWGNYRYKRRAFGVVNSQDLFDRYEVLKPSANKIRAVNALQRPNTEEELISFLHMVAYVSRYIDRFSSKCEPLRRLTKANMKFVWSPDQQKAFDDIKSTLTTAPVLIPYQPGRETMVIVHGRPELLGGALQQKTLNRFQPVHYVTRTLTDTKKRYSQIERETLAAEFTTSRLQMYLLGAPKFNLATYHKPLLPLLDTTSDIADTMNGSRLRRSERIKKSSYQGKYKDYTK